MFRREVVWVWTVAAIVVVGAVLRFVGTAWGLPMRLHPDEWVIVKGAVDMAQRNSFEPGYFMRPDHLEMQLSYLAYVAYAYLFHGAPVEVVYPLDPSPFVLISRSITATLGTASIVVAALIGRRFSVGAAVAAAFAFAFFPLYVADAHLATPDVPLTLAVLCVVLAATRYLERPGWRPLLLASLATAAGVAIKYPGALSTVIIAVAVLVAAVRDRAWLRLFVHGAGAALASVGMLFAISPVLFTNVHAVREAVTSEARPSHLGADGLGWGGNLAYYAQAFAGQAGVVVLLLALVGATWVVRGRVLAAAALCSGVVYWVALSAVSLHWPRWGLPMYVTPLLLASLGAGAVLDWYRQGRREMRLGRVLRPTLVGVGAVAAVALLIGSVAATGGFVATDTRVASSAALAELGIPKDEAVFEGYTPFLPDGPRTVFDDFESVDGRLQLKGGEGAAGPSYVVLSSAMGDRYEAEPKYVQAQEFYAAVEAQFPLVADYRPVRTAAESVWVLPTLAGNVRYLAGLAAGGLSGPTISVFEIPASAR